MMGPLRVIGVSCRCLVYQGLMYDVIAVTLAVS